MGGKKDGKKGNHPARLVIANGRCPNCGGRHSPDKCPKKQEGGEKKE